MTTPPGSPMKDTGTHSAARQMLSSSPGILTRAKTLMLLNFEAILVVLVLGSIFFISFFVVHKYAFLLFYFIPVIMAGFYLGPRHSVGTAILIIAMVTYLNIFNPFQAAITGANVGFWNLFIWGSFLTLTGGIVGQLQEKNNLQMRQLRDAYIGIIEILTKYLEAADEYTKNHSQRVAEVSVVLAETLNLSPSEISNIRSAALLHDIGKVEVLEIVQKQGQLTPEERVEIDKHTKLGAELILKTGTVLNDVIPLVLDHHRKYADGGESIPYGARIIAVADTYDAIRTDRPYQAGQLHHQAIEILERGSGNNWDPKVVDAMKQAERSVKSVYME